MNIIICGAGKVGFSISKQLSAQGHSVTVIDQSSEDIKKINDLFSGIVCTRSCFELLLLISLLVLHKKMFFYASLLKFVFRILYLAHSNNILS